MELEAVLKGRQSVRKYADKKIERETVEAILQAACLAPSWKNSQTRRYHVVMGPEMLQAVKARALPPYNAKNAAGAPVLIVSCYVKGVSGYGQPGVPANELGEAWGAYDLGLADENLLLKARELGLDTLVMGLREEGVLRQLLQIPPEEAVVSVIALGYRAEDPAPKPRRAVAEIATFH